MDQIINTRQCQDHSISRSDHLVNGPVPVDVLREVYSQSGKPIFEKQIYRSQGGGFDEDSLVLKAILSEDGKFQAMQQTFPKLDAKFTTFQFEGQSYTHIAGELPGAKTGFYKDTEKVVDSLQSTKLNNHLKSLDFEEPKCP